MGAFCSISPRWGSGHAGAVPAPLSPAPLSPSPLPRATVSGGSLRHRPQCSPKGPCCAGRVFVDRRGAGHRAWGVSPQSKTLSSCCSSGRPLTVLETSLLQLLHDRVYFLSPEAEASHPESLLAAAAFSEQLWFLLHLPAVAQGPREGPAWLLPLHPPSLHGASTPG